MTVKDSIVLCGQGSEAETAAAWAENCARAARRSRHAARLYGERVRSAYEEACHILVSGDRDDAALQISLEPKSLTPRINLIRKKAP